MNWKLKAFYDFDAFLNGVCRHEQLAGLIVKKTFFSKWRMPP
ncbi:hypothetical protein WAI05_23250 [Acinetobacter baumannii]